MLSACPDCDLLLQVKPVPPGGVARCPRCGAVLMRSRTDSFNRSLALSCAALVLFVVANVFPFLAIKSGGQIQETTLISGVRALYAQGLWPLATLVLLTTVLLPLAEILGRLYVLAPLRFNRVAPQLPAIFRLVQGAHPWAMMEVFMLGILVSIVKLSTLASIVPGTAIFAFAALIFVLAAASATLEPRLVWDRVTVRR